MALCWCPTQEREVRAVNLRCSDLQQHRIGAISVVAFCRWSASLVLSSVRRRATQWSAKWSGFPFLMYSKHNEQQVLPSSPKYWKSLSFTNRNNELVIRLAIGCLWQEWLRSVLLWVFINFKNQISITVFTSVTTVQFTFYIHEVYPGRNIHKTVRIRSELPWIILNSGNDCFLFHSNSSSSSFTLILKNLWWQKWKKVKSSTLT